MSAPDWNPRFVAYALSRGRTPEEQCEECMHDFIRWIGHGAVEFRRLRGRPLTGVDHAAFTSFLFGGLVEVSP